MHAGMLPTAGAAGNSETDGSALIESQCDGRRRSFQFQRSQNPESQAAVTAQAQGSLSCPKPSRGTPRSIRELRDADGIWSTKLTSALFDDLGEGELPDCSGSGTLVWSVWKTLRLQYSSRWAGKKYDRGQI